MIWLHCGDPAEVATTLSLVQRLSELTDDVRILITTENEPEFAGAELSDRCIIAPPPADSPTKIRAFLETYSPRSLIWVAGALRPALLRGVTKSGIPATLINARAQDLFTRGVGWLPRSIGHSLVAFERIMAADGATATRLVRGGVPREKVEATGPIMEEPLPLRHDQNELTVMAETLSTRPVWLAADVRDSEVTHMAAAHLAASRKSHRLLLVLHSHLSEAGGGIAQVLREQGLSVGLRSDGDEPEPEHQAYVVDLPEELGLWYRLAPLTFMGGTFSGETSLSPFDPIALGSAVIHGPQKALQEARYARLAKVEACREVRTAAQLGIAIGSLISPEQTARMALAGWEEITRNAENINALVERALGALEEVRPV